MKLTLSIMRIIVILTSNMDLRRYDCFHFYQNDMGRVQNMSARRLSNQKNPPRSNQGYIAVSRRFFYCCTGQVWQGYELSSTRDKDLPLPTSLKNADIECSRLGPPPGSCIFNMNHNVLSFFTKFSQSKKIFSKMRIAKHHIFTCQGKIEMS